MQLYTCSKTEQELHNDESNKIAAFEHEHMVRVWRELVDLSDSAVASAELSVDDEDVTPGASVMISSTNAE